MVWNGNVLTAKISAFPSQETACTLSDILMSDVEEKYFLSPKQQEVLLFKPTAGIKENAPLAFLGTISVSIKNKAPHHLRMQSQSKFYLIS